MVLDMNQQKRTDELLEQIHEDLTGEKVSANTPQSLRFIYCKTADISTATNLLGEYGLTYQQYTSLQDGIEEFQFNASEEKYRILFNKVMNMGLKLYVSNNRLPIQGALGSIVVTATIEVPTTLLDGSGSATVGSAPLSVTSVPISSVTLVADTGNGDYISFGNATTQSNKLGPGQSITISIDDLNKVYVIRNGGSDLPYSYIAG